MSMIVGQATQPRVALLIESSWAYGRGILGGVAEYIRQHGHWVVFLQEQSLCDEPPPYLAPCQAFKLSVKYAG